MRTLGEAEWKTFLLSHSGGMEKYPWNVWLNGEAHLIERGVDYFVSDRSFRKNVYRKQNKYGAINCLSHSDGFVIKAKDPHTNEV
tara:strand:+ start:309 stop:563 length:255 start_codon:yes stop_codon:yes gene_type:complete